MKPLMMFRARGVGAIFHKAANLTRHLVHTPGKMQPMLGAAYSAEEDFDNEFASSDPLVLGVNCREVMQHSEPTIINQPILDENGDPVLA